MSILKNYTKHLALMLSITLIAVMIPIHQTHATTIMHNGNSVKITEINENKVRIEENGVIEEIEVIKDSDDKIQKIISTNITTGVDETIIIDSEKHTAYSTLTDKIIVLSPEEVDETNESKIGLFAVGDKHKYKISFKTIASVSGDINDLSDVAISIITALGVLGVTVSNPVSAIVLMISGISGLLGLVATKSSKKGLVITTEEYMRSTTKNGKVYKYLANRIIDIGVY